MNEFSLKVPHFESNNIIQCTYTNTFLYVHDVMGSLFGCGYVCH